MEDSSTRGGNIIFLRKKKISIVGLANFKTTQRPLVNPATETLRKPSCLQPQRNVVATLAPIPFLVTVFDDPQNPGFILLVPSTLYISFLFSNILHLVHAMSFTVLHLVVLSLLFTNILFLFGDIVFLQFSLFRIS